MVIVKRGDTKVSLVSRSWWRNFYLTPMHWRGSWCHQMQRRRRRDHTESPDGCLVHRLTWVGLGNLTLGLLLLCFFKAGI